ncbi:hypothetical protein, conserved [Trypanosoma brucei brucei TREU927]|uniref:CSD domain-containing protein n=1 Tax=Trypanosoma brucei brucei (strain 927/4 GUTat10.1) TaxID=185431 RepID=Q57UC8_TRYB2|nr:hypothetical protein, conserved [Trypanosoma brucei brucei TREU927]AAX70791.1 hypothetical protein, conserved [Trypanosoma brucei]AAZ12445.1 hypothetical protein, conserved [Trypanosoma brucei brucei TREU927]
MFRLAGSRLAVSITATLLEKKRGNAAEPIPTNIAASASMEVAPRRVGTVTSFMHRRGYGFITALQLSSSDSPDTQCLASAELEAAVRENAENFFFPRSSLDGGFYVSQGQTVTFDVLPSPQVNEQVEKEHREATEDIEASGDPPKSLPVARHIRLCDLDTGKERPVTPVMLHGCVQSWDTITGSGCIAELDLAGNLHDDAPCFNFSLEDLDVVNISDLHQGCFVRFCIERGDRNAARRVIIDRSTGKRHAPLQQWRSSQGASRALGFAADSKPAAARYYGTVRELVDGRFGFIVLEETGESIFFHMSNVDQDDQNASIKVGDTVSFILRGVSQGKHAGKRTCLKIRRCSPQPSLASRNHNSGKGTNHLSDDDDDDEFNLLE